MERVSVLKNKVIMAFLAHCILLVVQHSTAMLIEQYAPLSGRFGQYNDLIYGKILLDNRILELYRFFGPINHAQRESRYEGGTCSCFDTSEDHMTDLLIQLFPSAGPVFNANGRGSFRENKISRIVGMLNIANAVRSGDKALIELIKELEHKDIIEKEKFLSSIFTEIFAGKTTDETLIQNYFRLVSNISQAICQERDRTHTTNEYPAYFTNYMISAYVWSILDPNELPQLAEALDCKDKYESRLTEIIYKDMISYRSVMPFRPGEQVIRYSFATYNDNDKHVFPDCVETTIRQLVVTLLCSTKRAANKGSELHVPITTTAIDGLGIELTGLPTTSDLYKFFIDGRLNARVTASDGSALTRNAWAKIIGGHRKDGILYSHMRKQYDILGGWRNAIKMIALLFKGYKAIRLPWETEAVYKKKSCAEDIISKINEDSDKLFSMIPDIVEVLNILFGVRTDVELFVYPDDLVLESGETFGSIKVAPAGDPVYVKHNTLVFRNTLMHVELESIEKDEKDKLFMPTDEYAPDAWIGQLYNSEKIAITGGLSVPESLALTLYPSLEFYLRMRRNFSMGILVERFRTSSYVDSIARMFYGFLDLDQFIGETKKFRGVPIENLIKLCKLVALNSENPTNIFPAITFLQENKVMHGISIVDIPLASIQDLFIYRCCLNKQKEVDEEIIRRMRHKQFLEQAIELYSHCYNLYSLHKEEIFLISPEIIKEMRVLLEKSDFLTERTVRSKLANIISIAAASDETIQLAELVLKANGSEPFVVKERFKRNEVFLQQLVDIGFFIDPS